MGFESSRTMRVHWQGRSLVPLPERTSLGLFNAMLDFAGVDAFWIFDVMIGG